MTGSHNHAHNVGQQGNNNTNYGGIHFHAAPAPDPLLEVGQALDTLLSEADRVWEHSEVARHLRGEDCKGWSYDLVREKRERMPVGAARVRLTAALDALRARKIPAVDKLCDAMEKHAEFLYEFACLDGDWCPSSDSQKGAKLPTLYSPVRDRYCEAAATFKTLLPRAFGSGP